MACERYRETLADVAAGASCRFELHVRRAVLDRVDAELGGLLAATPSLALKARIREAVAKGTGRPSFSWWYPGLVPTAAVLVTAFALFVLWHETERSPSPQTVSAPRPVPPEGQPPARPPSPLTEARGPAGGAASGPAQVRAPLLVTARASKPKVVPGPEVLVPSGEAEALARFARDLERRQVEPGSLLVADLQAPLPEPRSIAIAPLEIAPLDSSDASGT
jgi:hypothetical protein